MARFIKWIQAIPNPDLNARAVKAGVMAHFAKLTVKGSTNFEKRVSVEKSNDGRDENELVKVNNARYSTGEKANGKAAKAERERLNKSSEKSHIVSWSFGSKMCDARITEIDVDGFKFAYRVTTFLPEGRGGIATGKSEGFYTYELTTKIDLVEFLESDTATLRKGIELGDLLA